MADFYQNNVTGFQTYLTTSLEKVIGKQIINRAIIKLCKLPVANDEDISDLIDINIVSSWLGSSPPNVIVDITTAYCLPEVRAIYKANQKLRDLIDLLCVANMKSDNNFNAKYILRLLRN